ncbi:MULTISPECIES: anthranilate phosphoribosyltransferase [unclassified Wenzhouxiangella]|uniref:anthranilate phosphoribosyltransferase n=1 Tax=unclassified Wenzhouxiangella TaxID=2613841 RepID=UPI000E32C0D2|nr:MULTISPECIES: anthranilate phosphoribosyltransferase [unclassified Wenzhouxiangella]RFF28549.1 anthranilate phosphoribosyltransferase [Wenzhouxiangella sp. 15181]RFP70068.1 anthranilate phosphoribosyltransferase [Wenzhouxiangella sp. 15190]
MTAIKQALNELAEGRDLEGELMRSAMHEIMAGEADPAQVGGFLMALRVKGETPIEIAAAAEVMRQVAQRVDIDREGLTDIVGTGGDGASLFNVSTASAFAAAAAGVRVAKHGNRSVSSKSGAADVLEAAGCRLDLTPEQVAILIDELGVGFLFAPQHHTAMKHAIGPRKALGLRTLFNLLGPLTNPAAAPNQVLGVYAPELVLPLAEVMHALGSRHVIVVHSHDGLDEISIVEPTKAAELKDGEIREIEIQPNDYGIKHNTLAALQVSDAKESLALVEAALGGEPGPAADMVALNAGAAIYVSGRAESLEEGIKQAQDILATGVGLERLKQYANRSYAL